MIRDEERASKIQLARKLAELLNRTWAKDHSRPRLIIKTLHFVLAAKRHKKHKIKINYARSVTFLILCFCAFLWLLFFVPFCG